VRLPSTGRRTSNTSRSQLNRTTTSRSPSCGWQGNLLGLYSIHMLSTTCTDRYLSFRNPSLEFVAAPALAPAEVAVDAALMEQYAQELQRVREYTIAFVRLLTAFTPSSYRRRPSLSPRMTKIFRSISLALILVFSFFVTTSCLNYLKALRRIQYQSHFAPCFS
jgi:hypothetical protein